MFASLWLALLATSTQPGVRVLVLPATTRAQTDADQDALDEDWLGIFSDAFYRGASAEVEMRGASVVDLDTLAEQMKRHGSRGRCPTGACVTEVVKATGATHWIAASIARASPKRCRALVTRYDFVRQRIEDRVQEDILPCNSAWLVREGERLGRWAGRVERARAEPSAGLTGRSLPELDALPLPELGEADSRTSSATMTSIERRNAVERYKNEAIFLAATEDHKLYVIRGGTSIDDCSFLELTGRSVSPEQHEACHGNWWELAWLGLPLGALFLIPTTSSLSDGGSPVPFVMAAALTIAAPILALSLNRDGLPVESGEHVLPYEDLLSLTADYDAALLRRLSLVEADVEHVQPGQSF